MGDALELLTAQHDQIEALIAQLDAQLDERRGDRARHSERAPSVLHALTDILYAHVTMEEQLFYPVVRAKQPEELMLDAPGEHLALRRVLAELSATRLDDPRFEVLIAVLAEEFEHHAREEEEQILFPRLRQLLSEPELDQLGHDLSALFDHLLARAVGLRAVASARAPAPAP